MNRPVEPRSLPALVLALAAWACAGACGCGAPSVSLHEGNRAYGANDYAAVQERWTREAHVYTLTGLDTVLAVTATYKSWDFRQAYVARYAADLRLTTEERERMLAAERSAHDASHEFYVSLQASRRRWGDLTAPDPIWHVMLIDDHGREVRTSSIRRIERPAAVEMAYFPYTTPFRETFLVQFPKIAADGQPIFGPDLRSFVLRFASAQGTGELHWDVRR